MNKISKLTGKTFLIALLTIGMTAMVATPIQAQSNANANANSTVKKVKKQDLYKYVLNTSQGKYTAYAATKTKDGSVTVSYYQLPLWHNWVMDETWEIDESNSKGIMTLEVRPDGTAIKTHLIY